MNVEELKELALKEVSHAAQPHFTLLAQDITADLVVEFWVLVNSRLRELMSHGDSADEAMVKIRKAWHISPVLEGYFSAEKLKSAVQVAKAMRQYSQRKVAD